MSADRPGASSDERAAAGRRRGYARAVTARAAPLLAVLLLALPPTGCGDGAMPTAGDPECAHIGWRTPTPDAVVCPGTLDCSCTGEERCCVLRDEDLGIVGARCGDATACVDLPVFCDGPEDCAAGQQCCFEPEPEVGARCVAEGECTGAEAEVVCRADDDCPEGQSCVPAERGSYFDAAAAFCEG